MNETRRLYSVPTANGQRAAIALEEAGLAYTVRPVDMLAGEHRSAELLAINPVGRMPLLEIAAADRDPRYLYGSMAIGRHAARRAPQLLPGDPHRDVFEQWLGIIMTDLAPAFSGQFYLGVLAPEPQAWGLDFYTAIVERMLRVIDDHLDGRAFVAGGRYSLADILLYPTAATSVARLEGGLARWPNPRRWAENIAARPAVQRGMQACPGGL